MRDTAGTPPPQVDCFDALHGGRRLRVPCSAAVSSLRKLPMQIRP
jgi:hypothetical protein